MRYPTVTRILAIFLALCSVGLLCAGGFGLYTGNKDRKSRLTELSDMKSWAEDYRALDAALNGHSEAEELDEKLKSDSESHDELASSHRRELAEYSAAKSGIQMGSNALIQGDEKLSQGWEQYYKALELFKEKEQELSEGLTKFEGAKAALEASKKLYEGAAAALDGAKAMVNELESLDEIFESGDTEQAYDRLLTSYEGAIYAISQAESAVNSMLDQGLITQQQIQAIENEIIAATGMSSGEIKAKVQADYDYLLNSGGLTQEQFDALKAVYYENKAALAAVAATVKKYLPAAEEKLKAMAAEIQKAQDELNKTEPYIEQAKAALEEGRKGLKQAETVLLQGEDALSSGEMKLNEEQGKLNEKLPLLKEQKQTLEKQQSELNELKESTEERKNLESRRTTLSLKLRSKAAVKESCENGTELYAAAQDYIVQFEKELAGAFRNRIILTVIMCLGATAGLAAPVFIFGRSRDRKQRLLMPCFCAGISLAGLIFGYLSLNFVSSSLITALCAAAALMLSAYPDRKKNQIN